MPMLRCAFWLTVVYASILLHPHAAPDGADDAAAAARTLVAGAGVMGATLAEVGANGLDRLCAARAGSCGAAVLAAARGDADGVGALIAASLAGAPAGTSLPAGGESAPATPLPVPDPRRRARGALLTGTP